ncbi:MAG: hypothetical protein K8823_988 [Cenarchaeum symbiont of Oopsacas minuta]|nr:hypothetical protein [Cenarchaeum symbiont of Oopsacas minuta]
MKKIPVKIIMVTSPSGDTKKGVMLDSTYYFPMKKNYREKIKKFEQDYFNLIDDATKLFYSNGITKRSNLPSTTFWELGKIFRKFNDKTSTKFYITNYANSLQRDFGLTEPYIRELIIFSREFKKKEISNNVPMAIYRALIWKRNILNNLELFEHEKQKLIQRGKVKQFIGRENYKNELKTLINNYLKNNNKNITTRFE